MEITDRGEKTKRFHITNRMPWLMALILLLCFLGFGIPDPASADELILQNGDRLSGTIISMADGILTLATQYSEPIKIRKEKIMRIFMRQLRQKLEENPADPRHLVTEVGVGYRFKPDSTDPHA